MKSFTSHTGILKIIKRLDNSNNGNPRYLIEVDGYQCKTKIDSSYGYDVQNQDGKTVTIVIGTHYGTPTLHSMTKFFSDSNPC